MSPKECREALNALQIPAKAILHLIGQQMTALVQWWDVNTEAPPFRTMLNWNI